MVQALISACPKLLSSLAFAVFLFCLSMRFPEPIRPVNYEDILAEKHIALTIAHKTVEEVVQENEILLEKSDRDRKYAEEICKERQPLNAQKTFLENKLGNFESFSDLERKFKELEWQLEVERQHRRDEDKERRRLSDIAQLANREVILARNSTAGLNREWQVAKIDYLERLKEVDRQRHDAVNAEAASRKEIRAMRRMTDNSQTVDERVRLCNEEIDRLRAKLMEKTTTCYAQLAAKDKEIHDLELSWKSAQLDYAELEESLGLGGLLSEGEEGAEGEERVGGIEEGEDDDMEEGKDGDREEYCDGEKEEDGEGNEVEYEAYYEEEEEGRDGDWEDYDSEKEEDGKGNEVEYEAYSEEEEDEGEGNEAENEADPKVEEGGEEGETLKKGAEVAPTEDEFESARRRLNVLFGRTEIPGISESSLPIDSPSLESANRRLGLPISPRATK